MTLKSSSSSRKTTHSSLGAPSQHNQGSRKGKRAWRKNIDIGEVEDGLEGLRTEEIVTGTILQKTRDEDLFQIDLKGDEHNIRKSLPRFSTSQLTSRKILSQRSALPAIFSRTTSRKHGRLSLNREEKSRLLRIGKRLRRGPLMNTVLDPTELGSGSAIWELSEAVKRSGRYDPWAAPIVDAKENVVQQDGFQPAIKAKVKPPTVPHPRDLIELPAVVEPHQGTSYNPPASSHQELLLRAHEIEEERERDAKRLAQMKGGEMEQLAMIMKDDNTVEKGVAVGMMVGLVESDEDEGDGLDEGCPREVTKLRERKTRQQRAKAARLLAEKRLLADKLSKKRMLATINSIKHFRRTTKHMLVARDNAHAERRRAMQQRLKSGLIGQKVGRYKVPRNEVNVQLGEELSESLRGLKPEGNLFRDRFLSLQHRALIEPRVLVLPKKRSAVKVYEKHPWKRFE